MTTRQFIFRVLRLECQETGEKPTKFRGWTWGEVLGYLDRVHGVETDRQFFTRHELNQVL